MAIVEPEPTALTVATGAFEVRTQGVLKASEMELFALDNLSGARTLPSAELAEPALATTNKSTMAVRATTRVLTGVPPRAYPTTGRNISRDIAGVLAIRKSGLALLATGCGLVRLFFGSTDRELAELNTKAGAVR